jgi:apolipoprotein N-acyltransferase
MTFLFEFFFHAGLFGAFLAIELDKLQGLLFFPYLIIGTFHRKYVPEPMRLTSIVGLIGCGLLVLLIKAPRYLLFLKNYRLGVHLHRFLTVYNKHNQHPCFRALSFHQFFE